MRDQIQRRVIHSLCALLLVMVGLVVAVGGGYFQVRADRVHDHDAQCRIIHFTTKPASLVGLTPERQIVVEELNRARKVERANLNRGSGC